MKIAKEIIAIMLFLSLVCYQIAIAATAQADGDKGASPNVAQGSGNLSFLHTDGQSIVNENGEVVRLHGVNIGGWLLIEPWIINADKNNCIKTEKEIWDLMEARFGETQKNRLMQTYRANWFTENDTQLISKEGLNCVRLPIWWRVTNDSEYGGDLTYVNRCIEWCRDNGLYVILDLHGAPGGQSNEGNIVGEPSNATLWENETCKKQTIEWWEMIARQYKDEPIVAGYDLLNEAKPIALNNMPCEDFKEIITFYDRMYEAIRSIDERHIIIMECGMYSQDLPCLLSLKNENWTNVIYSFHFYPGNRTEAENALVTGFPNINMMANNYSVPIYVGEFNTIEESRGGLDIFRTYCDRFDSYNWSWTFWTFKKIGEDRSINWGLYGYMDQTPEMDFCNNTSEEINAAFIQMRTNNTERQSEWKWARSPQA